MDILEFVPSQVRVASNTTDAQFDASSLWNIISQPTTIFVSICACLLLRAVYLLYFHPLAKFPGPKIAALTTYYSAYHDLWRGGQYLWVIDEMHKNYGPIVRVRPDVLHVNDPKFIDKLYTQSPKQRRERHYTVTNTQATGGSVFSTADHDLHRKRRSALNPFFSKQNVRQLEPLVNDTLSNLLRRMHEWSLLDRPIQINPALRAATKDIITAYAFGEGDRSLDAEDCGKTLFELMKSQRINHLGTHANWLLRTLNRTPYSILRRLIPSVVSFNEFVQGLHVQIEATRKNIESRNHGKDTNNTGMRRTIFDDILQSDMPASEKRTIRLADEAMIIVVAGSETTASTLAAIIFHLLSDRVLLNRLKAELASVMPNATSLPDASKLDSLPLLNAIINEAIRLYPGATHRQDRVAPDEDLSYTCVDPRSGKEITYVIPAGMAVGMAAPLVNRDPGLYPNPTKFDPDRYIRSPYLTKYMMSFSRGTRQCLGINLAYQELQSFTAGIFRKYDVYDAQVQQGPTLELYKTEEADIDVVSDYITIGAREGSQGVRLRIRS